MNRALTSLCAALLALGACKDGGTPTTSAEEADLVVHLSATVPEPTMQTGPQGQPLLLCIFTIQALATGDMAARAEWTGGMVRYYVGGSTQPVSSMQLHPLDLGDVFGEIFSPTLSAAAVLSVTSSTPFSMEIDVSYRVQNNNTHRTATARSSCGLPPAAPAA